VNSAQLSPIANHLWQSTLFAAIAGLLTLFLRNNRARSRHWVWLAASLKFLIPFSVLISLGGHIHWRTAPQITPSGISVVMDEVTRPFTAPAASPVPMSTALPPASIIPAFLYAIWAGGFLGISCSWWVRWRQIRVAVRAGTDVQLALPIRAVSSPTLLEPGVFGVLRPVMLLPEGIFDRLTVAQLKGVIAHEICHVNHRDNLMAALHMFVETVFWFHPLVWWIGRRMVEERERACDEEVLRLGGEPRVYAEGILNVCKLYAESPLTCVSGIAGANLRTRIAAIMNSRPVAELSVVKKTVLAGTAAAALALPVAIGVVNAPAVRAQSSQSLPVSQPRFEVASIKRCALDDTPFAASGGRGGGGGGAIGDPGMFRTGCVTVRALIQTAYIRYANGQVLPPASQLKSQPLQGGPAWIDSDRYTIDAKPGAPQAKAVMGGPMLQALLEDRFKLKVHREKREVRAYALVVAKGGPKLEATKEGGCTPADPAQGPPPIVPGQPLPCGYIGEAKGGDGIEAVGVTMASICQIF